jgi:hypothetical protein
MSRSTILGALMLPSTSINVAARGREIAPSPGIAEASATVVGADTPDETEQRRSPRGC